MEKQINLVVVCGASDVEMQMVKNLCNDMGITCVDALCNGLPVHSGNAYRATDFGPAVDAIRRNGGCIICVECGLDPAIDWTGLDNPSLTDCCADVIRCDHHREGDAGFGLAPDLFFAASSIGQLIIALDRLDLRLPFPSARGHVHGHVFVGVVDTYLLPDEIVLAAAADHCLSAAYAGLCPGVVPEKLKLWRVQTRAGHQGRTVDEVLRDIENARNVLRAAPMVALADGVIVRDLRGAGFVPELPEAAAIEGVCFMTYAPSKDGRKKLVCQSGTVAQIEAFMSWLKDNGYVDIYGDPARGFAGGYE